jgi:hypothetical protein
MEAAKKQVEDALQQELRKEKQTSQEKEVALKELEKNFNGKVRTLEIQLGEREGDLKNRDKELESLRERLTKVGATKEQAETLLQQELKKVMQVLQAKEATIKELEQRLNTNVHALETQVKGKDKLLQGRDKELEAFRNQLTKMETAKKQVEDTLREELKKEQQASQAKDSTIKKLEDSINSTVYALERQLNEQEKLLKSREEELESLRSKVDDSKRPLNGNGSGAEHKEWEWGRDSLLQGTLTEERRAWQANESTIKELEKSLSIKVQALETQLSEKEKLLKSRDGHIAKLATELKEKRTQLAKEEIAELQSIERRDIWKRRLAKVGIRIGD